MWREEIQYWEQKNFPKKDCDQGENGDGFLAVIIGLTPSWVKKTEGYSGGDHTETPRKSQKTVLMKEAGSHVKFSTMGAG